MKHLKFILIAFLTCFFIAAHSQETDPVYTVEDYYTGQEVRAMIEENKQFLLTKYPEFASQVTAIANAVADRTMTPAVARDAINKLSDEYLVQALDNMDQNENRLFSGEFQPVLENPFVDQEISEDSTWEEDNQDMEDWNSDWTMEENFEFPKSPAAKAMSFLSKFYLAFGFHTWIESGSLSPTPAPELNIWGGGFTELGWMGSSRLGKPKSKLYVNYGLSLVWNRARWTNDLSLTTESPTGFVSLTAIDNFKRANLRTRYVTGMFGFSFVSSTKSQFRIDLNGFAGVHYRSIQSIKTEGSGSSSTLTTRHKYGVNALSYGICPAIGFKNFAIYARYDMSGLFKNSNGYDYQPFSIGIRI